MKKNLLLIAAFLTGAAAFAQDCTPQTELNENFNAFTFTSPGTGLPQNCWSKISTGPLVYISGADGENVATFYASNSANVNAYLITPELTTLGGNYELSFDTQRIVMGPPPAPGTVTIQLGTLSDNTDASTFVEFGAPIAVTEVNVTHANIAITAAAGQKYIAFRIIGDTAHNAASIDNVVWSEIPAAECTAVATLNEDFNAFTFTTPGTGLPQNCWSSVTTGPLVYISGADGENAATFYASNSANVNAYLITPELTTLGDSYELSFDTQRIIMGPPPAPGTVTIQLGTLSDNTDASTFLEFGDPIAVTEANVTHANIAITAAEGQKYIAFRIIGDTAHNAASIDNVKWTAITAGLGEFNKSTFSIYPNPSTDRNVTISHNLEAKGTVNVFTLTGANVFTGELNEGSQNLDLSALSAGVYIVKIQSGSYSESKKLIIQ